MASVVQLHLELTNGLPAFLDCTTNFCEEADRGRLRLGENIDMVCRHAFLSNEHLLGSVNDEVSSRVVRTFVEVEELLVPEFVENAVGGTQHDRHLVEKP